MIKCPHTRERPTDQNKQRKGSWKKEGPGRMSNRTETEKERDRENDYLGPDLCLCVADKKIRENCDPDDRLSPRLVLE